MQIASSAAILAFGIASYVVGCRDVVLGRYAPNRFSRIVWLLLAAISLAGVVASGGASSAVLLSGIFLVGNAAICALSFWRGSGGFGHLERACLAILGASVLVWVVFDAPLIGLGMSLLAHLVGGAPTYRAVWRVPRSESAGFWSLFFIASALSLVADLGHPWRSLVFPAYFVLFDGGMTALALRRTSSDGGPA